jgi:hypothetical protein
MPMLDAYIPKLREEALGRLWPDRPMPLPLVLGGLVGTR